MVQLPGRRQGPMTAAGGGGRLCTSRTQSQARRHRGGDTPTHVHRGAQPQPRWGPESGSGSIKDSKTLGSTWATPTDAVLILLCPKWRGRGEWRHPTKAGLQARDSWAGAGGHSYRDGLLWGPGQQGSTLQGSAGTEGCGVVQDRACFKPAFNRSWHKPRCTGPSGSFYLH